MSEQYHLKLIIMIPDSSAHCSRNTRAQREFDRRLTERKTPFDEVRLALREKEYYYVVVLVLVESNTFRFFPGAPPATKSNIVVSCWDLSRSSGMEERQIAILTSSLNQFLSSGLYRHSYT